MPPKKIPLRMCVGCRSMLPKRELLRVVRTENGCKLDKTGKVSGRGAYICPSIECLEKAKKTKALERALECSIEKETFEQLSEDIAKNV